MSVVDDLVVFAATCRAKRAEGQPTPVWVGDLSGADLRDADLRGADLSGALVEGGIVDTHVAGAAGSYQWHALRLQDGAIILQYGCERRALAVWLSRGPEYGAQHGHTHDHWATGPAVAIAAAVALGGAR